MKIDAQTSTSPSFSLYFPIFMHPESELTQHFSSLSYLLPSPLISPINIRTAVAAKWLKRSVRWEISDGQVDKGLDDDKV